MIGPRTRLVAGMVWIMFRILWPWLAVVAFGVWWLMR